MKRYKINDRYASIAFETSGENSDWFGYYNYDTLNFNQTKMLCNRAPVDGVAPQKGVSIELGYYDLNDYSWHHIDQSDSWNWQQGAMMQWLPGVGNENKIIFNCSRNNHLVSKIKDIETGESKYINWAIYGLTPDGKKSIALNLERSYWCRAYHYQSVENSDYDCRIAEDDGIFEIDLENNECKRIISIQDIIAADFRPDFLTLKHWVEHIMINEDGTKFCFLHRFSPEFNVNVYQTRLFVANIDGTNLQVIPGWDKVDWSHFGWNKDSFAIYTVVNNRVASTYKELGQSSTNKTSVKQQIFKILVKTAKFIPASLRKKLKGGKSYYQFYTLNGEGSFILKSIFDTPLFDIDGHPSFTKDHKYMITDSYPNSKQFQRLMVFDIESGRGVVIGEFFANYHGNPASCDLHPKLCSNNNYVVVDTAFDEHHHMMILKLDWNKIKSEIS